MTTLPCHSAANFSSDMQTVRYLDLRSAQVTRTGILCRHSNSLIHWPEGS